MSRATNQQLSTAERLIRFLKKPRWLPNCLVQSCIKRSGKLAKTFTDLRARPRGESKCEGGLRLYFHKARRQRRRPDSYITADARDQRHVLISSHPGHEM